MFLTQATEETATATNSSFLQKLSGTITMCAYRSTAHDKVQVTKISNSAKDNQVPHNVSGVNWPDHLKA